MKYLDRRDNRDIIEYIRRRYFIKGSVCAFLSLGVLIFFYLYGFAYFAELKTHLVSKATGTRTFITREHICFTVRTEKDILLCDRPAAVKHYSGEILALGEDILARCTEDPIRLEAKRLLCLHYYEDLNDTEKAREIALSLPGRKICREDMLPIISQGEAKLTAIQENISSYTTLLASAITAYVENNATLSREEKIEFCETARKIRQMIYPCGDMFGGAYLHMMLLKDLAVLYMSADRPDKALDCLQDCASCAADFDALPKSMPHASPLVKGLRFSKQQLQIPSKNKKTPLRNIFIHEIMPLACFDSIKYHPRVTEILKIFG